MRSASLSPLVGESFRGFGRGMSASLLGSLRRRRLPLKCLKVGERIPTSRSALDQLREDRRLAIPLILSVEGARHPQDARQIGRVVAPDRLAHVLGKRVLDPKCLRRKIGDQRPLFEEDARRPLGCTCGALLAVRFSPPVEENGLGIADIVDQIRLVEQPIGV